MRSAIAYPHLTAQADRVSVMWNFRPEITADGRVPDWEPTRDILASVNMNLDLDGIRADCGLQRTTMLHSAVTWASQGTSLRGCLGRRPLSRLLAAEEVVIDGVVPGTGLGGRLDFQIVIIVGALDPVQRINPLSATMVGSILWKGSRRLLLEGNAAQFPMEAVDFSTVGYPSQAPWLLDWQPAYPSDPFLKSVRLFVNAAHPRVKDLVSDTDREASWLADLLRFDVAAQMVRGLLNNKEFVQGPDAYSQGSVGAHVYALIRMTFPHESMSTLAAANADAPGEFEARLKAALRFL